MKKEENRDKLLASIAEANKVLEAKHQELMPHFSGAIVRSSRDPQRLAKKLSEKFPTLRAVISFEGGLQAVVVEPVFRPFGAPNGCDPYTLERLATQAAEMVGKVSLGDYWPNHAVVAAYASGFDDGSASQADLDEMKEENRRLRSGHGPSVPWSMMMGPWGFR